VLASSHHRNERSARPYPDFPFGPDLSYRLMRTVPDYLAVCPQEAELDFTRDPGGP
jgi:hypothetical protein